LRLGHVQELTALKEGETVYKAMGPVLVRQDTAEALANVQRRMAFIDKEV